MKHYAIIMVTILVCTIVGCGKGYVPMGGTVTFSDDGTPLTKGTVCFEQGPHYARGTIDEQGRYTLGFDKPGSGLPKGTYNVYVTDVMVEDGVIESSSSMGTSTRPKYRNLVDPKYNSAVTSGLTVVVDGSSKTFDFTVGRAK